MTAQHAENEFNVSADKHADAVDRNEENRPQHDIGSDIAGIVGEPDRVVDGVMPVTNVFDPRSLHLLNG